MYAVETCLPLGSDGDEVSCYLSSNSLSDDDEVTRLHSQCPEGEDEDHDIDDATDGGRRVTSWNISRFLNPGIYGRYLLGTTNMLEWLHTYHIQTPE